MNDRLAHLTESQRRAVRTIDRSVLVSAAAGSGKTTVLAERCAALVCDLPTNQRCRIDELLVVTFTEAAAAEMKTRIGAAIRERLKASPHDGYLQQQIYLLETASISTIHAFCRSLIQRWFPQAGVDPQAAVLSGDEAQLLKDEVLEAFFVELYAGLSPLGLAFQTFVDDYSAGNDRLVAHVVLQLHEFISSLPDPDGWLTHAMQQLDPANTQSLLSQLNSTQHLRISEELRLQIEFSRQASLMIRQCWPVAAMHAEAIDEHAYHLEIWLDKLNGASMKDWENVAGDICAFEFDRAKSRPRDLSDDDKAAFDCAKSLRDETKKLFANRLQEACCSFTAIEYTEGLLRIAPYARTLAQLATEFDHRYRLAKSDRAAIDFNDLQRYAHRLLHEEGTSEPSAIARQLQQQYRHVLVDEFQDVDPLQEAIIRCVSRELTDPPQGNLFTVGDIKQSIYRFRLAEPTLFADRAGRFQTEADRGSLIHLQENFRSRPAIIDAINIIFRSLMSADFGGSNYDSSTELHAGLQSTSAEHTFDRPAVDIHLLEPVIESTRDNENEDEESDTNDELEGIEREAYLIGDLIQDWMSDKHRRHVAAKAETPSQSPNVRPLEYSDIVILLRSLPHKAGPIADILRRMGLPVRLDRDRMGMDSTEVRDVLSLLQVLDNAQQDIPIAAVLRSPLLGRAFNENELLEIRFLNREISFYQAVQEYAERGSQQSLRDELAVILAIIDRYRGRIQRTPVAEVLWEIYEEYDYLSYVAGLPDGARRREHLLSLHELARQFAGFTRQGLQRFLRFVEEMAERDQSAPSAASATNENVIRIMTIHTSKGLEFPVVILADLQKSFNLTDIRTPVLLDRKLGIAMRAADSEKRILYPTLISQLAAESGCRESLSEELRVLYVALTRAREYLLLIGRTKLANVHAQRALQSSATQGGGQGWAASLPRLQLETACNYLDWLLPALGTAPRETVQWPGQEKPSALFRVSTYERHITDQWRIPPAIVSAQIEALSGIANLQPLAENEPLAIPAAIEPHLQALGWMYPATELTTVPARISVTELKRRWQADLKSDERVTPLKSKLQAAQPAFMLEQARLTPSRRGSATHRFLQLVDLARSCDAADLAMQLRGLVESGRIAPADVEGIAVDACTWFLASELGRRIRSHSGTILREVPFVSRLQPSHYDPLIQGRDHRDVLLLRGMIDVLLRHDSDGIELIDYKTDQIAAGACEGHAENYRAQIDHYTAAIEGIYGQVVSHRWLVFLDAQCTIDLALH